MSKPTTLRELWFTNMKWTLTDTNKNEDQESQRTADYSAEQIFELLSKNIFNTQERQDFKRLSVSLSDYLKTVNFMEEINNLQLSALAMAVGYYYCKLEEKHIVEVKEKSNEKSSNANTNVRARTEGT